MAKTKQQKIETQKLLEDKIKKATSAIFVKFSGLLVNDSNQMRKSLRKEGVGYTVVKKTLLKRALKEVKIDGDLPNLEGEVAIVYGEDVVLPAKAITNFIKKLEGKLTILGGVLLGKFLAASDAMALSKVPSKEILYGKFVNVISSPIQGFASVLGGIQKNFVVVLDQIAKTKSN